MEPFSHCTEAENWYVRVPKSGCHDTSGKKKKYKPAKSMAFPRNIASNVKLDTKNHIVVKSTQKYCRCKHCCGR